MKKLFYILIINCTLLIPSTRDCFCQSITWQRTYENPNGGDGEAWDICQITDGNYIVTARIYPYTYILKINNYGDTIWTKILDEGTPLTVAASTDGSSVFTGSNKAVKLDSQGNIVWNQTYNIGGVQVYDIKLTPDDGFIMCGRINGFDGFIMKIDLNGNLQWAKTYTAVYANRFYTIDIGINGGYIAAGHSYDGLVDTIKAFIIKTDDSGNVIWQKKYKIFNREAVSTSIKNIGQFYILGGSTADTSLTNREITYFSKLDTNGNILTIKYALSNYNESLNDLKLISNSKYALSTEVLDGPNLLYSRAVIVDSSGNVLHQRSFTAGAGNGNGTYLKQAEVVNGGYIMMAGVGQFSTPGDEMIYVVRLDSILSEPPFIGINTYSNSIPENFILYQNYPNPFNPMTIIRYDIPKNGLVKFPIYDILGREIYSSSEIRQAGRYEYTFDGSSLASGIYFYHIQAGAFVESKKMVLVK